MLTIDPMLTVKSIYLSAGAKADRISFWHQVKCFFKRQRVPPPRYVTTGTMILQGLPDIHANETIRISPAWSFKTGIYMRQKDNTTSIEVVSIAPLYKAEIDELNSKQNVHAVISYL